MLSPVDRLIISVDRFSCAFVTADECVPAEKVVFRKSINQSRFVLYWWVGWDSKGGLDPTSDKTRRSGRTLTIMHGAEQAGRQADNNI